MTVGEAINELKKMPKNAELVITAHDNSILEIQGYVTGIFLRDYDEERKQQGYLGEDMGINGIKVVIAG